MCQQRNERRLAHVGRLPAHVGTGDDEHAAVGVEAQIVGHERRVREALDHGVTPAVDGNTRFRHQLRARPLEHAGALGQAGERIELAERAGGGLQRTQAVDELRQDLLVQLLLARQRLVACAQHPVLEALQLLGDEALRGFHRLAPDVVPGDPLGIAAGDLDEESLHAVVADLEGGESGAFAFAPLELEQEGVGVGRDAPQLIELAIVAARDDITLAHQGGGLGGDGG